MAKLGERVIEVLGGVTQSALTDRYLEGYAEGYNDRGEDEPVSGTVKTQGYRRSRDMQTRKGGVDQEKALRAAWQVYTANPIAKRALAIKRDYIVGRGIQITAEDKDLQKIIDGFRSNNRMDRRVKEFTLQLFLFGCQCYPVFVRRADGAVTLGYIDPAQIEKIVTHPENAMEMWAVVVKANQSAPDWSEAQDQRIYRIVRRQGPGMRDEDEQEDGEQQEGAEGKYVTAEQAALEEWESKMLDAHGLKKYTGSCIYEKVNSVSNQPEGYSDLLQVMDWLDQHDETLFSLGEREQFASYFSWDVKVEGANDDAVQERARKIRNKPPKRGSVNVHNDAEEWTFNYPDLKQAGSVEAANAIETHALGGLALPRHWYGHGDETNRATAQAQGDPTWRSMEHDQDVIRDMLLWMLEFARDQAAIAGYWNGTDGDIEITMPEMTTKDVTALAAASAQLATALMVAEQAGWMPSDKAAEAWAVVMAELGVEYDLSELEEEPEEPEEPGQPIPPELPEEAQEYARLFAPRVTEAES